MEGKEEDVNVGANKFPERQPIGTAAQTESKDYKEPPPAPFFEPGELKSWSFYRAGIAEFIATFLFLYVTVLTVMGVKRAPNMCASVGIQGIAWAFGGMIFALVYCTAGISEPVFRVRDFPPDFLANIQKIRELGALRWPVVSQPQGRQTRSPLRSKMGKIVPRLPRFVDKLGENRGLAEVIETRLDVDDGDGGLDQGVVTEDRPEDVATTRAGKRVVVESRELGGEIIRSAALPPLGGSVPTKKRTSRDGVDAGASKVSKNPRRETLVREEVDYGFSYHYKAKDTVFTQDANACADLVSKIHGVADDFSSVDRAVERGLYKDWARKMCQILAPLPIGFAVFLVHLATIPITGTGINPARSLGAAIIYNKGHAWDDHWIFWVGPFIGAALAALYHQIVIRAIPFKSKA